jgi:cobalt-zinc-cadmium resistance protein CzcA
MERAALARYGIRVDEVQEALEVALGGRPVAKAVDDAYTIDILVLYPNALRGNPQAIRRITVPTRTGALITLDELADIRMETGPVQVSREQAQRLVIVQADVRGRDLGSYVNDVRQAIESGVDLPPGVFLTFGGQFENQERAMRRLRLVVPLSIGLITLLLYTSLRSWPLALLVLTNLPFAAVGGVLALWARGLHLGVSAAIGFIALFGVAVLNGLVMLTTVERLREGGMEPRDAAVVGARERLRPVLMTALVASIGFIPVAVSHGVGAEVQRPLATVVIGGLVTSTLLTLFVVPTLYAWLKTSRAAARPSAETAVARAALQEA